MNRIKKTIILITIFGLCLIWIIGCSEVPYTRPLLSIDDLLSTADDNTICIDDGFDAVCVKAIPGKDGQDGRDGKDGKDGKDGQTLIAVREVRIEVIVEKIIETIVEEGVSEIPVEVIVDRVVTEYMDSEVRIEVFVERTVEIIKEVVVEKVVDKEIFVEVPVEVIVEKIVEIPVEVPVTVTETVVVYQTPPETPPVIVENKVYDSQDYSDWVDNGKPTGQHEHTFWHTHNGKRHGHRIAHPDGQQDNFDREHEGYDALAHE